MSIDLRSAVKTGDSERVAALLDEDPGLLREAAERGLPSLILLAVYHGHVALARLLAERAGGEIDIFEASALGEERRVRNLLEADPELANATAPDGFQPLGLACFFGQEAVARILLEAGADVHVASRNAMRVQPIHAAAARRSLALVEALLDRGADPNARQHLGYVALHTAAQHGDSAMVDLLLARGADVASAADDGKTAADFAETDGYAELASRLRAFGAGKATA